jgi:hypothetical protein
LRQVNTIDLQNKGYEGRRLLIQAITAAAVFAAGGVVGGLIVKILGALRMTRLPRGQSVMLELISRQQE